MNSQDTKSCASGNKACMNEVFTSRNVSWWMLLMTAVLAVPAFASVVVVTLHPTGPGEVMLFVLSCWLCVYVGLKMVKNPKITVPYMLEKVIFSDAQKGYYISSLTKVADDMDKWKRQYENCDQAFMGLSKQPVWGYLDELMRILDNVRQSVMRGSTVEFADMKALNAWLISSKPSTIEHYLQALRGVYAYGKSTAAEQGKDLDRLYPELEKGLLLQFELVPNQAKAIACEILSGIRTQYPFIAAQLNYAVSEIKGGHLSLISTQAA